MKRMMRNPEGGFSLVELLAVVLILAVLAAVAVPLCINTADRQLPVHAKGNLAAIAAAASAFALRNGEYPTAANVLRPTTRRTPPPVASWVRPRGLSSAMACPLDNAAYTFTGGGTSALVITCPHASTAAGGDNAHTDSGAKPTGTEGYQRTWRPPQRTTCPSTA